MSDNFSQNSEWVHKIVHFCTRGVTQKNKPGIFVSLNISTWGEYFGLVVGLIYSLREDKYSPLVEILQLDVKYHGLFYYSNVTSAEINNFVYSLLVPYPNYFLPTVRGR